MTSSLRSPLRVLAWTAAIALFAAAVLDIVLGFNLLSAPPVRAEGSDFIDFLEVRFAWERDRLPLDAGSAVLYVTAFLAMAGVGVMLGRSSHGAGERGSLLATAFLAAGILGAAAQLTPSAPHSWRPTLSTVIAATGPRRCSVASRRGISQSTRRSC